MNGNLWLVQIYNKDTLLAIVQQKVRFISGCSGSVGREGRLMTGWSAVLIPTPSCASCRCG